MEDTVFILSKEEYPEQFEYALKQGIYSKIANDECTALYLDGTQRYLLLRDCPVGGEGKVRTDSVRIRGRGLYDMN